jgi:HK97 family phage portal protein
MADRRRYMTRSLPAPGDPLGEPVRVNIPPNPNPASGSVGPNVPTAGDTSAQYGDPGGYGAMHVAYDPRLDPVPWAGWPVDWNIPVQAAQGMRSQSASDVVFACIDLNARITANMPVFLTKYGQPQPGLMWMDNPQPLIYPSWNSFWEKMWFSYQGAGELILHCDTRYSDGRPQTFHVAEPWMINIERDQTTKLRRFYAPSGEDITDDVLFVPYYDDGVSPRGIGPLEFAGEHLLAARALNRYGANLAGNGGALSGVLQHKYRLSPQQSADMRAQWVAAARQRMGGAPAVLDSDTTYKEIQVSPKDMALRELAEHSESRIAVLLGVPPFLVGLPAGGDSMTYSSTVSLFDYHWRALLDPKSSLLAAALSGWALPLHTVLNINPSEYIRESAAVRSQFYEAMWRIVDPATGKHAMSVEEIRQAEQFTPAQSVPTMEGQPDAAVI